MKHNLPSSVPSRGGSLGFLALLPLAAVPASARTPQHPNVVLIVADDLGYGDVSAYGNTTISTPHIDRLAHEGLSFTDGHATSATSTPSRYGLMTGCYPWRNPDAFILPGDAPLIVDTAMQTLPKLFQRAGYRTAAIGKWHLGMGIGRIDWNGTIAPAANTVGFDYTHLIAATVDRVPTVYVEDGRVANLAPGDSLFVSYTTPFPGEPTALTNPELVRLQWSHGHNNTVVNGIPRIGFMKGGSSAYWDDATMAQHLVDEVRRFVTSNADSPFFLYYGLHEPHVPRTPMTAFAGATPLGARGDVIVEADWCVGEVMRTLEEQNLLDNTIVIFTSDNGPVRDDGYVDGARESAPLHDPLGGLRGGKYSLYDGGTRVPFFVYWKGHIAPRESSALVSQMDLPASFAALLGDGTRFPDSRNTLSTFLGRSDRGRRDMVVESSGFLAYRYRHYALIPPYRGGKVNITGNELGIEDHYALYDLRQSPAQRDDISATHPRLVKKLRRRFLAIVGDNYQEPKE